MNRPRARYGVGVDVGGTFTDLVAVEAGSGRVTIEKADTGEDGVGGVFEALSRSGIDPAAIETFVLGSTVATNALVERALAPVAFLGTDGFTDVLEIRRVWRRHLFGWRWERPRALVPADLRFGIPGRIDRNGREIEPLDIAAVDAAVERIRRRGLDAVAVCYLFSFLNPDHERRTRERIRSLEPEIRVTLSSDINPEIKEYERASTTVIAAGLAPGVGRMLRDLETRLERRGVRARPHVIKSNGGIMAAATALAKPHELVRSGPAGGVASAVRLSRELALPDLITLDAGGTTADVAVVTDGEASLAEATHAAWDIPLRLSMADVRSVGAGGGSVAFLDAAGALHVGPRSAGARPGPACYGRGGREPTVTDAALIAGLIDPGRFLGGRMRLDSEAAGKAIDEAVAEPLGLGREEAAGGILHLAAQRMAQLINEMTLKAGLDPRGYVLVAFGGAGPLFAAAIAREIGIRAALIPVHPAVWSACGGLGADAVHDHARSHPAMLSDIADGDIDAIATELAAAAARDLERDGLDAAEARFAHALDIRYKGQSHHLRVPVDLAAGFDAAARRRVAARFEAMHERLFGHRRPGEEQQLVTVRLQARVPRGFEPPPFPRPRAAPATAPGRRRISVHGEARPRTATVHERRLLAPGDAVAGPAIVEEDQTNTLVPAGMRLRVGERGELLIRDASG